MKAQQTFGFDLRWTRLTAVFLIDVAVLAVGRHWPGNERVATYAWWSGVGVAVLVAIVALVTYRRVPLTSALAARVLDRFSDPEKILTEGRGDAVDHQRRYGREVVGIREYQGRLVAVIAVGGPAGAPTGRHHRGAEATVELPVDVIADRLRQFDVRLDGIDIVSVGVRETADEAEAAADESSAADESATAEENPDEIGAEGEQSPFERRSTWLVLRMDPQHNVAAIAARDSVAATLGAAAERLAQDLDGRLISARVVTAEEFADVDTAVLAGLDPARITRRRRRLKQVQGKGKRQHITSFWVSPYDITSENLERLWLRKTDATVVTVRLAPRRGGAEVSVVVRYHSAGRLRRVVWAGLNRLTGRQLTAVCNSLPAPLPSGELEVPVRELAAGEDLEVALDPAPQRPVVRVGASA